MIELLAHSTQAAEIASICEVVAHPADYDGKLITISGEFLTDWRHAAVVVGDPCRVGIVFGGQADLGEPWARIKDTQGRYDLTIRLTVTGRYRWDPHAAQMYPTTHLIEVDKITSLDIQSD